jgi:pyruvate/2-oxoglutarate dehydrogenase complex dihydrolipoamide dehydrogenase (E3) component
MDVLVIGAGPAGVVAALRAAELGAHTTLVTRGAFGGMAATDGPVPVRVLAHAARLMREARQLDQYGIRIGEPRLDFDALLARVGQVVEEVQSHALLRTNLERAGVIIEEYAGTAGFVDAHTIESERGVRVSADAVVICAGGKSRRLPIPGSEHTATHSDAWALTAVPPSMLIVGAGATGAQLASVFNALGSRVQLFERGPRILPTEDEDVSRAVADAFRAASIAVHEGFDSIDRVEHDNGTYRLVYSKDGQPEVAEASLIVVATGWAADTDGLHLPVAGVSTNARGYIAVDDYLLTSAPHIFAAGDVTGRLMLVPQALHDAYFAATNAVRGPTLALSPQVSPVGSFTDPEYAQVGLTEAQASALSDVLVVKAPYSAMPRPIIDGRTIGFAKLIVDRRAHTILGCHIVGERAVEIAQVASVAMAGGTKVEDFARIPLSFPTYTNVLGRAALMAARRLDAAGIWDAPELELLDTLSPEG